MMKPVVAALLGTSCILAGCAPPVNLYQKRYQAGSVYYPPTTSVRVIKLSDDEEIASYLADGYDMVGLSSFACTCDEPDSNAREVGMKVGADLVAIYKVKSGEKHGVHAIPTYQSGSNYTVNTTGRSGPYAYGYGGNTWNSTSTITSPGTMSTTYVPYVAEEYSYTAAYLKEFDLEELAFGVFWANMTEAQRKDFGRNRGALAAIVYKNTPAFDADIVRDDLLVEFEGVEVRDADHATELIDATEPGQTVAFVIWRDGDYIGKVATLR